MSNVDNLMLTESVVDAVTAGYFHSWAIGLIDEGIELLTRRPAGVPSDGAYPEESVHRLVGDRCRLAAERLRSYPLPDDQAT